MFYANPNKATLKLVTKDVAANKSIFPAGAEFALMAAPDSLPQDIRRVQTRIFTSFKSSK